MLVVAAFIQQVLFEGKQIDPSLEDLALKHCSLLQSVSENLGLDSISNNDPPTVAVV